MNKMIIHIGSDKTGTSHIQSFLARNKDLLENSGWKYPETPETRKQANGGIFSGNGYRLYLAAKEGGEQVKRIISKYPKGNVVISSEALSALAEGQLNLLAEEISGAGYSPLFVFYARAPIDYFVSGVIQWAKRNGGTAHPLPALEKNIGKLRSVGATDMRRRIDLLVRAVGRGNAIIRDYDSRAFFNGKIEYDFLNILGIDETEDFELIKGRTNPSLTEQSLALILAVNRLAGEENLSVKISDALMEVQSEVDGNPVRIPRDVLERASVEFVDDIEYIRREYGLEYIKPYTEGLVSNHVGDLRTESYIDLCAAALRKMLDDRPATTSPKLTGQENDGEKPAAPDDHLLPNVADNSMSSHGSPSVIDKSLSTLPHPTGLSIGRALRRTLSYVGYTRGDK